MLEIRPISALETRRGIIELLNTIENSAATEARLKKNSGGISRLEPGAANHSSDSATIWITAKKAIHGLRGPVWSATEPSTGDSMAMTKPAAAMP